MEHMPHATAQSSVLSPSSDPHRVVAAVDDDRLAGDAGRGVAGEEDGRAGDLLGAEGGAERGALDGELLHLAEAGNAARRGGLDRAGGDGVDANPLLPEVAGEVADR